MSEEDVYEGSNNGEEYGFYSHLLTSNLPLESDFLTPAHFKSHSAISTHFQDMYVNTRDK